MAAGDDRDGRRARWDQHRRTRRQQLIMAVIAAVRDEGPDVGMDDIARHSGVAKPVFYRYFVDKADVHHAVGRFVADVVVGHVAAALGEERHPRDRLAASIDAYLRLVEADPAVYAFVVHAAPPSQRVRPDPVEDYATVVGLQATGIIGDLLRQAGQDAGAAEAWGFGLVGMVRTAADRWLAHPTMSRAALVDYLTDLATGGLAARLPAAAAPGAPLRALPAPDEPAGWAQGSHPSEGRRAGRRSGQ